MLAEVEVVKMLISKIDFTEDDLKKSLKFCKNEVAKDDMDFLSDAVAAIEKQLPCEPRFQPPNYYCRKCGSFVANAMHRYVENTPVYCAWCGQRLRW